MDKLIEICVLLVIIVIVVALVAGTVIGKPDFLSQCQQDGFTKTECEMMWSEKNRVYADGF